MTDEAAADLLKKKQKCWVNKEYRSWLHLKATIEMGLSESWDHFIALFVFKLLNTQAKPQNSYSSLILWRERVLSCDPTLISFSCIL